ncbi:UNVERIFIED_CONTAM: hypothetical protein FKN15_007342 [Acipenser sinensis]
MQSNGTDAHPLFGGAFSAVLPPGFRDVRAGLCPPRAGLCSPEGWAVLDWAVSPEGWAGLDWAVSPEGWAGLGWAGLCPSMAGLGCAPSAGLGCAPSAGLLSAHGSVCFIGSELREIPDNQEVFAHSHTDQSIIVELLEYQGHVTGRDAARYSSVTPTLPPQARAQDSYCTAAATPIPGFTTSSTSPGVYS